MVLMTILAILFTLVAAALVLIVLVQRPQGGGLSGAFGGAGGGSDTVFGGRTGDALTVATVVAFILFLGLSIALNLIDVKPGAATATTPAAATTGGATTTADTSPINGATVPTIPGTQQPSDGAAPVVRQVDPSELPPELLERARQNATPQQPPAGEPGGDEPGTDGTQPE